MKFSIFIYAISAVFPFIMAYALAVGDLPHNWMRIWMGIPVGALAGYAEIVIGIGCGAFLVFKVFEEWRL